MTSSPQAETELRTRIRQQEVVMELGEQALETDDLDQLLHAASVAVAETLDNDYCKVLELLPGGDEVLLREGIGWRDGLVGNATVSTQLDSQAGYTLLSEEPVIVDDLRTEDRFSGPELLTSHDVISGISVIIGSVEDPWGVLGTHTTEHRDFTEHDATFVQNVANLLASAIEKKQTQHQLHEEESLKEQIVETSPVGILVMNADGEVEFANEHAENLLGRPREEMTDVTHDDPRWRLTDGDGDPIPASDTPFEQVMAADEPVMNMEIGVSRPDGQRTWLSVNGAPLQDNGHGSTGTVFALEDITEEKRLQSELETTFSRITDAFFGLDTDWNFTYLNDRAEELIASEVRNLVGKNIWEEFPEAVNSTFEEEYRRAMETQEPTSFEDYYPEPLDTWFDVNVYPSETGISVYFRDITERKERGRELTQYETIVETIQDGIYVADEDGCFTMVNDAYTDLTGYSRDELIGEPATLVVDDEILQQAREKRAAMADGEAVAPTMEGEIQTADGERVPVEATFASLAVGRDERERVGVVRDITERKEQRRQLEESERRYRTLVENFPNGAVGLFDEDLCYTAVGGELMEAAGIAPEERVGTSVYDIYPDDLIEEVEPYFHAALDGEANSFEADYHNRHLLAYALPIRDADDTVFAGMLVVQDITELKETQRQLEESNERLEQFAYAASHDLQEPLRMVSSYLTLIERRYEEEFDEEGQEFLEFAVDGADRMRDMVDGLLKYSRIDTQGEPLEPVDANAVIDDVLADLEVKMEETDADTTVESLPHVLADDNQLRQVFQNLISNALSYTGDGPPCIHISAERDGTDWILSVQDEGIGIDPRETEHIFDVFKRGHTSEEGTGTGIGLAICQRIIERHGGEIWVESEPGDGATFSFTLSAVEDVDE